MIEQIDKILTNEQLSALLSAISSQKPFVIDSNGLKINVNPSENAFEMTVNYTQPEKDLADKVAEDFNKSIETIDDDLFVEVCDTLGPDKLQQIQKCLKSDKVDSVRSGIAKFKMTYKDVLINKINYYTQCLNSLQK